jgi:tetratricopeptide (TPR) repeat protein
MSTSIRFTNILVAVAMTASVAACNDVTPPAPKVAPVATTESPKAIEKTPTPTEAPAPTPPPTVATEAAKTPAAVDNDDDGPHPVDALAAARKLLDDKQYDRALKLANIAVKKMPKRSGAWNTLGRVELQMGKRKDAIASFEKAVDLNPKNPYARNNLGLSLIYDKRFEEAADALEQAVELEPVEAYMWNNLGMAYEQLDRLDDARVAYGNAIEMDSDPARDSLERLKGVTSVVKTAKVDSDTTGKDGTIPPTTVRE